MWSGLFFDPAFCFSPNRFQLEWADRGREQHEKGHEVGDKGTGSVRAGYGRREVLTPCPPPFRDYLKLLPDLPLRLAILILSPVGGGSRRCKEVGLHFQVSFSELQPLKNNYILSLCHGKAKISYHFWKELFNQDPVKKRLESSYGSLG